MTERRMERPRDNRVDRTNRRLAGTDQQRRDNRAESSSGPSHPRVEGLYGPPRSGRTEPLPLYSDAAAQGRPSTPDLWEAYDKSLREWDKLQAVHSVQLISQETHEGLARDAQERLQELRQAGGLFRWREIRRLEKTVDEEERMAQVDRIGNMWRSERIEEAQERVNALWLALQERGAHPNER